MVQAAQLGSSDIKEMQLEVQTVKKSCCSIDKTSLYCGFKNVLQFQEYTTTNRKASNAT